MRRWLDRLPLAQRLLLSSVAFAGPIAVLVLVALASTTADLREARRGAAALSRLGEAGTGATAAPTATSAMADELPEARDRIARAVTVLAAARARRALSPTDGAMLAASAEVVETRDLPGLVAAFQKVGGEPAAAASRLEAAARSFLASLRKVQSGEDASIATALAQGNAALDAADALRATALSRLGDELEGRVVRHERLRLVIVALALLAAAIGASHVHYIVTGLSAPMGRLTEVASRIAEGRLADARAGVESGLATLAGGEAEGTPPRNEIRKLARAMKEMTASLLSLLSEVRRSGDGVADSARRLSTSARDLEATASEQAASSHEVTATSREISRRAGSLARTMGELGAVARETAALASTGRSALTGMEAGILELTSATGSVSARLSAISGKAESIGAVVTTIGRVAEQTNLLSLNAAIEAEKAGDAGRGFAVVAREIRRLADRTAHSAVDIGDMVQGMRSAVRSGVTEMDGFVASVRKAGDDLRGIGGQLESVIDRVSALLPRFAEVGTEVEAQAASAGQISEAMAQVSSGARQTRDALEELGRLLARLRDASDGLSREVARFHLDGTEGS